MIEPFQNPISLDYERGIASAAGRAQQMAAFGKVGVDRLSTEALERLQERLAIQANLTGKLAQNLFVRDAAAFDVVRLIQTREHRQAGASDLFRRQNRCGRRL